nr:glycosyltransferase family 39 protein [Caldilineaceae bacterium]
MSMAPSTNSGQAAANVVGERVVITAITLAAFGVRLWALDAKGLAYDEAATALMARASPAAIIRFHWEAAFEHPPLWQLLMHGWSLLAGQSEFALRYLPALGGVLVIPLIWQLARGVEKAFFSQPTSFAGHFRLPHLSALLAAIFPILVYYSQEARMYTLVVALALATVWASKALLIRSGWRPVIYFALLTWLMVGLHYYSVRLVAAEAVAALLFLGARRSPPREWVRIGIAFALALAPLAAWMLFAPGFQATIAQVMRGAGDGQPDVFFFLDGLWRDLSFGAIRWAPAQSWLGYWLLPLVLIGGVGLTAQATLALHPSSTNTATVKRTGR